MGFGALTIPEFIVELPLKQNKKTNMKIIVTGLLLFLTFSGCDVTKKRDKEVAKKNNAWYLKTYIYADGSGNKYVFNKNMFEYFPVKPENSSTGTYSGGVYVKLIPELNKFYQVVDLIQKAYESKKDHSENREKGTGSFRIEDGGTITEFILNMRYSVKIEIEKLLREIKETK